MTRSGSFARTEQLNLEDTLESQDSQVILDALRAEFGVGRLSESPVSPRQTQDARNRLQVPVARMQGAATTIDVEADSSSTTADVKVGCDRVVFSSTENALPADKGWKKQSTPHQAGNADDVKNSMTGIYHAGRQAAKAVLPRQEVADTVIIESSPTTKLHLPLLDDAPESLTATEKLPGARIGAGMSQGKKMETSQQTPTQVNEDRDYDEYCQPGESSPPLADTLISHDEPRTLNPDDTGAVNFGNLSPGARPSSQVSEDGGFENTRGEWRAPDHTSQQFSSNGYTPYKPGALPPETPALPKNPFAAQQNGGVPFAASQLFGQTPFMTSAAKINSPTSSRPSPNIFHNTISPNNLETSPLKNRANVSSPTVMGTSSPPRLNDVPATVIKPRISPIQEETPCEGRYLPDDMIPESPTVQPVKLPESRQPLAHYEPMKKSQERKAGADIPPMMLATDSDSDDAIVKMRRKKRMEKIRLQAAEEMGKIKVQLPSRKDSGDGRNRKRRKILDCDEHDSPQTEVAKAAPEEILRGSQKKDLVPSLEAPSAESTKATPREETVTVSSGNGNAATLEQKTKKKKKDNADDDMIPATSPVRSLSAAAQPHMPEAELPSLHEDMPVQGAEGDNEPASSSLPPLKRRTQRTYSKRSQAQRRRVVSSSVVSDRASTEPENGQAKITTREPRSMASDAVSNPLSKEQADENQEMNMVAARQKSSVAPTKRSSRLKEMTPQTPLRPRTADQAAQTSSSLTVLSTTPAASAKTTPDTQASPASDRPTSVSLPSPAPIRRTRAQESRQMSRENSPHLPTKSTRMTARAARLGCESTDELQQSPSSSAMDMSMVFAKSSRMFRQSIASTFRGRRLFEGMAFAISMPSNKENEQKRSNLEAKITQAGGLILQSGFQELFEASSVMSTLGHVADEGDSLRLTKASMDCGFTALIADQHSRKVKYMQALALGLPCLAHQWITACLNKGVIVDWEPYLLASGASAVLGDAIRSRSLQVYNATEAKLVEIVQRRPKLLAGQSLLAVVGHRKGRSEGKKHEDEVKKQQYIFLAQALGPSIYRVPTTQLARDALQEFDKAGNPFAWLYLDESIGTVESVIVKPEATGKKRRRTSALAKTWDVRVLHDELVIQSLILGRMVDGDEMYF